MIWICKRCPSIILAGANQTLIDFVLVFECPDDCSNQGTCDASSGVCNCEVGFAGDNCAGQSKQIFYSLDQALKLTAACNSYWVN